jgi:phosphoadenosine phosphosulfate reductase
VEQYQPGLVKVNPLTNWTKDMVADYIKEHNIPSHPLTARGYTSIGCEPCTRPTKPGEDPRAGRWAGKDKTECGIHTMHLRDKDIDAATAKDLKNNEDKSKPA